jgi:tetratricopeptide (TPR) repeat protein
MSVAMLGDTVQALDQCDRALTINPGAALAYTAKASIMATDSGQLDEALSMYEQAVQVGPRETQAYDDTVRIHLREKADLDSFITEYEALRDESPHEVWVHGMLAFAYSAKDAVPDAIDSFETLLGLVPDYADAHCDLAELYERVGQKEPAIDHWNICLALNIKTQQAERAWQETGDLSHIVIVAPAEGDKIAGQVQIRGSAQVADSLGLVHECSPRRERCRFLPGEIKQSYYKIEYRPAGDPSGWVLIDDLGYAPVVDGVLATWDTDGLPEGVYVLRLTVVDNTGNFWPPHEAQVVIQR